MKHKESELYYPLKEFFENKGFKVQGEVKNCDVVAIKEDITVVCEMKTSFNLKLLYQILDRKSITENVYAVIPRPTKGHNTKEFKNIIKLLKALDMGLITVAIDSPIKTVEVIIEPYNGKSYKNSRKVYLLKNEFDKRNINSNIGGVNKQKILTAYMEKSIKILCYIGDSECVSLKDIKCICGEEKTSSILQKNVYGWFERVKKGFYKLSKEGREFLLSNEYEEVKKYYIEQIKKGVFN